MARQPLRFFRLAEVIDEFGFPAFPGMRLVANLTYLAKELNKWPSEVYKQYLYQPQDIELMVACMDHRNKKEEKERDKMQEEQDRLKRKYG
jgi:hypothetical protein